MQPPYAQPSSVYGQSGAQSGTQPGQPYAQQPYIQQPYVAQPGAQPPQDQPYGAPYEPPYANPYETPYTQQPYGQQVPGPYGQPPYAQSHHGSPAMPPQPPYMGAGAQAQARRSGIPGWAIALIAVGVSLALVAATVFGGIALARHVFNQAMSSVHGGTSKDAPTHTPAARPDSVDAAFDTYYTQKIDWQGCGQGDACATITAPSDWSDAKSTPIDLHLAAHWARNESKGTLFINPGGPGASGADYLKDFTDYSATDRLLDDYDIIGFDPRGVGDSTPIECGTDQKVLNDFFLAPPATETNLGQLKSTAATYAKACKDGNRSTLDHVDTQSVARDLDMMRALMGSDRLDYLGFSYGTYIGATYAALFPAQVGRLVLDGAIDPQEDQSESLVNQAVGFENALKTYLKDCMGGSGCPFSGTTDDALAQIQGWLRQYDDKPVDVNGESLNGTTLMYGIIMPLYNQDNWPYLTKAFRGLKDGDGTTFMFLADTYLDRSGNKYTSNSMEANSIVNCLDDPPTSDMAAQKALADRLAKESPTFGRYMAYGNIGCDALALDRSGIRKLDWSAKGADPILVVGTTGDPATPYDAAVSLAKTLESGRLLTYKGEGHTAYDRGNECVATIVDTYLVDGGVPEDGATCG